MKNNDKLKWVTKYLESNTSLYSFAKANGLNYHSLKNWISKYEAYKDAWQAAEIVDDEIVDSELKPISKDIVAADPETIKSNIIIKFKTVGFMREDIFQMSLRFIIAK